MPTPVQATFTTLTVSNNVVVLSTPKTKAMFHMNRIAHITMNSTTPSISIDVTDTTGKQASMTYPNQAAADADWTKLQTLLNKATT